MQNIDIKETTREDWIKLRRQGIGGSDAGAICKLNPYMSQMSVYLSKVSEDFTVEDNESMRLGRDLEDYVVSRFEEETGFKTWKPQVMYVHPEYNWMIANVDRMVDSVDVIGLECKTTVRGSIYENDEIPPYYLCQCHHYMAVTGAKAWWFACLIFGKGLYVKKIDRDEDIINNLIFLEKSFWEEYVLKKEIPPPDGSKDADEIIFKMFPEAKRKEIELLDYTEKIERFKELSGLISQYEEEKNKIKQEIQLEMGDNDSAISGDYNIRWKNVSTNRFDSKNFQKDNPELYLKYLKNSTFRRFDIKKINKKECDI